MWFNEEVEKEQSSPISVLDFPYNNEEEGSSPFTLRVSRLKGTIYTYLYTLWWATFDNNDTNYGFGKAQFYTGTFHTTNYIKRVQNMTLNVTYVSTRHHLCHSLHYNVVCGEERTHKV